MAPIEYQEVHEDEDTAMRDSDDADTESYAPSTSSQDSDGSDDESGDESGSKHSIPFGELAGLAVDARIDPQALVARSQMRTELISAILDDEVAEMVGDKHISGFEYVTSFYPRFMRHILTEPRYAINPENQDVTLKPHFHCDYVDGSAIEEDMDMSSLQRLFRTYRSSLSERLLLNTPHRFRHLNVLCETLRRLERVNKQFLERMRKLVWVIDIQEMRSVGDTNLVLDWLAGKVHFGFLLPGLEWVHFHFVEPKIDAEGRTLDISVKWFMHRFEFRSVIAAMKKVRMQKAIVTGLTNKALAEEIERAIMSTD